MKNWNKKTKIMLCSVLTLCIAFLCVLGVQWWLDQRNEVTYVKHAKVLHPPTDKETKDIMETSYKNEMDQTIDRPTMKEITDFTTSKTYEEVLQKAIGKVNIPSLNLEVPIFPGTNNQYLKAGATTYTKEQVPGQGNYVLFGHNLERDGVLFSDIPHIKIGSEVIVTQGEKAVTYVVQTKKVVSEKETRVLDTTEKATLTLITCNKATQTNQRVVVTAIQK
ncbi:class A sortase [Listeria fleischmannii]|uniref:class A sortase n=1 Tax=Listeria fleischmannii TaxID=1069827 RepID=UPI001627254D|nr:class A sortase [Listeria fleischmannii]MBC1420166.1 class A sortase [Listeria fleischmannii]